MGSDVGSVRVFYKVDVRDRVGTKIDPLDSVILQERFVGLV